ncbi:MAG: aldehyde ferredoxin oxidoreductase family protein [Chloroflexota bacterium]
MQPILKINLTTGETETYTVPPGWERDFVGGASLAARLLYGHLIPDLEPFAPEAPLLFLNGPLTGTAGPAVGRFVVCGRSPATGLWAESNCGGFWGPELRFAGFDGLWITGKASGPVYLWINGGQAEVRDARELIGQDTFQTQGAVREQLGVPRARVAVIGPAGEQRIPFAGIFCDHGRTAGRTGLGAVMGSKNLKAIAVKGGQKVPIAQPELFAARRAEANRRLKQDPLTSVMHDLGSAGGAEYFDYLGEMPKKYFSAGVLEGAEKVSGPSVAESILAGVSACHACVIACGRVVDLGDGQKRKGPEYETLVGFGPNLGLTDPVVATRLGELCDRFGLDVISMSGTIGLAFRLFEMGKISLEDSGGMALEWGNAGAAEQCIHLALRREGLGEWLAQGSRALAAHFGAADEAVQVNGLELAYHDPRGASGMALVYATSPRGACHNQSDYFLVDIGNADESLDLEFFDRQAGAEKAANVARHQDWRTVNNSLVLCVFANVPPQTALELLNAADGLDWELPDLLRAGERGWNLKRAINHRFGLTRSNDTLPKGILEPLPDGGAAGYVIPFEAMLSAYYAARGWDPETGRPTRDKLHTLGLDDVAGDLWG